MQMTDVIQKTGLSLNFFFACTVGDDIHDVDEY
jgi:hypothetical protein